MSFALNTNDTAVGLIREKALWMRRRAFRMVYEKQLGHPGGGLLRRGHRRDVVFSASCATTRNSRTGRSAIAS